MSRKTQAKKTASTQTQQKPVKSKDIHPELDRELRALVQKFHKDAEELAKSYGHKVGTKVQLAIES